jgi:hypothetical protein
MSSRRLAALFGCEFDQITEAHLEGLAQRSVPEDQDLDFKSGHYDKGSSGAAEISKDIAAFANHLGGRIVLGIAEDSQGQAEGRTPVALDDGEVRRIESLIAGIHPMVTGVRIRSVKATHDETLGYYVIDVPRSPMAPHGLWRDKNDKNWLCFPVRHGTTTYYMTETQLASKYRDRFTWARDQVDRLSQLHSDGNAGQRFAEQIAVAVAVAPAVPGERPLTGTDGPTVPYFLSEVWQPRVLAVDPRWGSNTFARRRFRSEGSRLTVELHTDGSGWARVLLGETRFSRTFTFSLSELEATIVELLSLLGTYAVWAGAGGDAAVSVWLYDGPAQIGLQETGQYVRLPASPAETTAPVDEVGADFQGAGHAAYPLVRDLVQDMNLAEPTNIQPDGTLKTRHR